MRNPEKQNLEKRMRAVEDELEIRNLVARFTDAVNERRTDEFRRLWAEGGTWEIGAPFSVKATGVDAIGNMLEELFKPKVLFLQLTHSGVVMFTGDNTAKGRFTERERGKGESEFYENLAVYHDDYIRGPNGWRFDRRYYEYRFLDTNAFQGQVIPRTR